MLVFIFLARFLTFAHMAVLENYDSVVNTVFRLLERQFGVDLLSWFLSQAAQSAPKWFNDKEYSPGIPLKVA